MTATMERPKTKAPRTVTGEPSVAAAIQKLDSLRQQLGAATKESERLRNLPRVNSVQVNANAVLEGKSLESTTSHSDHETLLADSIYREQVAQEAIAIQERKIRELQAEVVRQIHAEVQPENEALGAELVQAIDGMFNVLDKLAKFHRTMSERGAPLYDDQWRGLISDPGSVGVFRLPMPEASPAIRENYRRHIRTHYAAIAEQAGF